MRKPLGVLTPARCTQIKAVNLESVARSKCLFWLPCCAGKRNYGGGNSLCNECNKQMRGRHCFSKVAFLSFLIKNILVKKKGGDAELTKLRNVKFCYEKVDYMSTKF